MPNTVRGAALSRLVGPFVPIVMRSSLLVMLFWNGEKRREIAATAGKILEERSTSAEDVKFPVEHAESDQQQSLTCRVPNLGYACTYCRLSDAARGRSPCKRCRVGEHGDPHSNVVYFFSTIRP